MDSEGNGITEKDKLGLLLYRGGTVCADQFSFKAADAICREMNFTQALEWTVQDNFDAQSNYSINMNSVRCSSDVEWKRCSYSEYTINCEHSTDVFLSCTAGRVELLVTQVIVNW